MEALAAVSLAGNILQFVDFSGKVISSSKQLYRSADGSLVENSDSEKITKDLKALSKVIQQSGSSDPVLGELCIGCIAISEQLLHALEKLQVKGKHSRSQSLRKALKNLWGKQAVRSLEARISGYREQLILHLSVDNR